MKPHGILFNGAMVRAILDGRKTQTRRIVEPQSAVLTDSLARSLGVRPPESQNLPVITAPHGPVGRRVWVRETFTMGYGRVFYRASEGDGCKAISGAKVPWRPSIHMPQWAARIWLEVTEIRCQRLQDISEEDAVAEGCVAEKEEPYDYWDGWDFRSGERTHTQVPKEFWPEPPDWMKDVITLRGKKGFNISAAQSYRILWNSIYLPPAPVYGDGKRIVSYISYAWSEADFAAVLPEAWDTRIWKGKPLTITSNPWVWAYTFKRIEKP